MPKRQSKIEKLIAELCPEGVAFKELGEVAEVGTGSSNGNEATENGKYPLFVRSKFVKSIDDFEFDEEAILIPGEGGVGEIFHYINGKYALHQRAYRIHFTTPKLITKFAYYYLFANFLPYILKKSVNATVKSIRKPMIEKFQVPIPPLAIQQEIVKILDTFTTLEAELEAELEARKKQYEYFRNQLLMPIMVNGKWLMNGEEVEWKTLGEVALEFGRGKSRHRPRNDPKLYGGNTPFIQTGDIRNASHIITEYTQTYSNFGLEQSKLWPKGTLSITIAANIAETTILGFDSCFPDSVIGFVANPEKTNSSYVEYLLSSFKTKIQLQSTGSAQDNINMGTFEGMRLPFPPLAEQERIVAILDKFDALVNDISVGLPAELNARRKQYEYYRNKLLSFKRRMIND